MKPYRPTEASIARWRALALASVVACAVAWSQAASVAAQDARSAEPTSEAGKPPAEAVKHYQAAKELYASGRYREAVVELETALALDPTSPNLMYNAARVYELLGEIEKASTYYTRYRDMLAPTDKAERERINAILQRLAGAKDTVQSPEEAPRSNGGSKAPTTRRVRGVADTAFWVTVGAGAAGLAVGGVYGVYALREESTARDFVLGTDGDEGDLDRASRRADKFARNADIAFVAGGAAVIAAALLYVLREREVPVRTSSIVPSLSIGRSGAALVLEGRL